MPNNFVDVRFTSFSYCCTCFRREPHPIHTTKQTPVLVRAWRSYWPAGRILCFVHVGTSMRAKVTLLFMFLLCRLSPSVPTTLRLALASGSTHRQLCRTAYAQLPSVSSKKQSPTTLVTTTATFTNGIGSRLHRKILAPNVTRPRLACRCLVANAIRVLPTSAQRSFRDGAFRAVSDYGVAVGAGVSAVFRPGLAARFLAVGRQREDYRYGSHPRQVWAHRRARSTCCQRSLVVVLHGVLVLMPPCKHMPRPS